ncbi:MAG: peptidase MA family metallohydrolase [Chloroflexota bacterium]
MRSILALTLSLGLLLVFAGQARAQSGVEVTELSASYIFGEEITFSARIMSPSPLQDVYLFFLAEGDANTRIFPVQPDAEGRVEYRHLIRDGLVRPFAQVEYWFQATTADGQIVASEHASFLYEDNRFPWQTLENEQIRVHWYTGDVTFGQAAFDAARAGLEKMTAYLGMQTGSLIHVFIYASAAEVQDALSLGGYAWVGGSASPDLGVALTSIEPGEDQLGEMARQVPHELTHILLYRLTGPAYVSLPVWLVEGIASQAEQATNADYIQALSLAQQNGTLLEMTSLCAPFPADASGAILAYAQSESFVRYLHAAYGTSGLRLLIQAYADGLDCEQGATRALGLPVSQLDVQWRQSILGENVAGLALQNLLPYLVILVIIFTIPLWGILKRTPKADDHEHRHK